MEDYAASIEEPLEKKVPKREMGKVDTYIVGIYIMLCIFSIVESYSASSREISENIYAPMLKHLGLLGIASFIMWFVQRINYTKFLIPSLIFGVITFFLMIATMFMGVKISGASRSIPLFAGFTLQPAEMAKIAIVFVLTYLLAKNLRKKEIDTRGLVYCVSVVSIFGFLLLLQGLTNTILFMCISFSMLIIGGTKGKKLLSVLGIYALVALLFLCIKTIHDKNQLEDLERNPNTEQAAALGGKTLRNETWSSRLNDYFSELFGSEPYKNETILQNDQKLYSYLAQAHGGLIGQGPGGSRETSRLPLAFSDYVFSIVIEDTGFVGGVFLMILYLGLLIRAGNIARRCSRAYPALLIIGMSVMVVAQAFFHMAINTGVFPVSGQQLPLISKGGTSVLMIGLAFGVMLSVSRSAEQKGVKNVKDKDMLPESMQAANPTGI